MPEIDTTKIRELAKNAMKGRATAAELEVLLEALQEDGEQHGELQEIMDDLLEIDNQKENENLPYKDAAQKYDYILDNVLGSDKVTTYPQSLPVTTPKRKSFYWYRAAMILFVCGLGVLIALSIQKNRRIVFDHLSKVDQSNSKILPGKDKAILTLGDGRQIVLDSVGNGVLADQNGVDIHKVQNGQLIYTQTPSRELAAASKPVPYNSVFTPRGGKYKLVLPDGTKVWLNADSKLKFPTRFMGDQRIVSMEGEAYFEVAKDAKHPFIVQTSRGLNVRVLGTHFNVMDYKGQPFVKTTLLEGSVKVTHGQDSLLIVPGQQVVMGKDGGLSKRSNLNLDKVVAWKNGLFYFDQMHIEAIMQALSRWYDVDVVYEGSPCDDLFSAIMNRDNDIHEILSMLEATEKVHFKITGRTIQVLAGK